MHRQLPDNVKSGTEKSETAIMSQAGAVVVTSLRGRYLPGHYVASAAWLHEDPRPSTSIILEYMLETNIVSHCPLTRCYLIETMVLVVLVM